MKSAWFRYLPLVLLAIAWEVAARLELVSSSALPPLTDVVVSWIDMLKTGELVGNAGASLYRGSMGLFLAIVVGGDASDRREGPTERHLARRADCNVGIYREV